VTSALTSDTLIGDFDSSPSRKARGIPGPPALPSLSPSHGHRPLYGSVEHLGVCIKAHDFQKAGASEWSWPIHGEGIELCLNLVGSGSVWGGEKKLDFEPLTSGFYVRGRNSLRAWRPAGRQHRFITIEFSDRYLHQHLDNADGALHPLVEHVVRDGSGFDGLGELHRLTCEQEQLAAHLLSPPVFQAARSLWYHSKVLQLMVDFFFERRGADELFCDRQKRLARDRADRVIAILKQRLSSPPGLEELGREAGCSPYHLSRTFSQVTGITIPQYTRKLRMERAAELLRSGRYNVTEAALEVGYSSLSHFSQAFCQVIGCCPGLYPLKKPTPVA
jgi:AraC family transcriptional regulator